MTVYLMVQVKIKNHEAYARYAEAFMPIFDKFNGTMLSADFNPKVLDGNWDKDRVVLMSFPSEEDATAWLTSNEYKTTFEDRKAGADTIALLAKGIGTSN